MKSSFKNIISFFLVLSFILSGVLPLKIRGLENFQTVHAEYSVSRSPVRKIFTGQFLGDSITFGLFSTTPGGFRESLINSIGTLRGSYLQVGGWQQSGGFGQNRCTCVSGYRVDEVKVIADMEIPAYAPDAVWIHLGTNDATQRNTATWAGTEADSIASMGQILDKIRASNPTARVFLAKIIPNQTAGADTIITSYNTALQTMRDARSDASYITMVDMNAAFRANANWKTDYMSDVTHPNAAGYAVMAATWLTAYQSVFTAMILHDEYFFASNDNSILFKQAS